MLLSEYYSNSIHKDNGKNYEIIDAGKNQRANFVVKCIVCLVESNVSAASILSGRKPCLCSKVGTRTSELKIQRLLPIIQQKSIILKSSSIEHARSKIDVECLVCSNSWQSTYNSLCLQDRGCHFCNGTYKKSEEEVTKECEILLSKKDCSLVGVDYTQGLSGKLKININCNVCNLFWTTSFASVSKGCGCPSCAKSGFRIDKPAYLYLLRIVSEDSLIIGYKYGITLNINQRVTQHNKECRYLGIEFIPSYIWPYKLGILAKDHEKAIKIKFGSFFEKYQLPSGHTETIPPDMLSELVDFQTKQYRRGEIWQE